MKVCIYLRKSRADEEAEKQGQGETLSKHRKQLMKIAKDKNYSVVEIKEEVLSGESIFHRPKMLELLQEIESNKYDGVIVMDMQRLGRGDMQDQGLILKTFKDSNTMIITPNKTYDLANEFDEEYSEFEAFMSRKELKMITRRMQRGVKISVEEGNFNAPRPPFGYDIKYVGKCRTLEINNDKAEIVKMIFEMYVNENIGGSEIANRLNALGFRGTNGNTFKRTTIISIIKNPVYNGKIIWNKRKMRKSKDDSKKWDTKTNDPVDWVIVDGKHNAIIDNELFNAAKNIIDKKYHVPYQLINGIANPLAGIIVCSNCGYKMTMKKSEGRTPQIMCTHCNVNKSSRYDYIESAILGMLENRHKNHKFDIKSKPKNNVKLYEKQIVELNKELNILNNQRSISFDLLEQGLYTKEIFLERSNILSNRIDNTLKQINELNIATSNELLQKDISHDIDTVLKLYNHADTLLKNKLLKTVIREVIYTRPKNEKDFIIYVTPRF